MDWFGKIKTVVELRCTVEHVFERSHLAGIPNQGLVEGRRLLKHRLHVCDMGCIPCERLVERGRRFEHTKHICECACLHGNWSVQAVCVCKHLTGCVQFVRRRQNNRLV